MNKILFKIGFVLVFLSTCYFVFKQYYSPNQILLRPSVISVQVNNNAIYDQSKNFLFDNDKEARVDLVPNTQQELKLTTNLSPIKIDKLGFDFGNLYVNQREIILYKSGKVVYSQEREGNKIGIDSFSFPRSIEIDKIELIFPKLDKQIGITEIFLWQNNPNGIILFVPRSIIGYFMLVLIIWVLVILSGCLTSKILNIKEYDLALIYPLGLTLIFVISIFRFFIRSDYVFLIIPLYAIFSLVYLKKEIVYLFVKNKLLFLIHLLAILLLVIITSFLDLSPNISRYDSYYDFNHTYAYPIAFYKQDYLMPFGTAKIFLYNMDQKINYPHLLGSYSVSDRTPFIPLFVAPFLSFFGDRLFVYQAVIIFLVSLLVTISTCFKNIIFTTNFSKIVPLLFIGQFFLYLFHFVPTRLVALYFLIYYFNEIFFNKNPNWKYLLLFSLLAFFTHPITLPYIFIPTLFLIFVRKDFRKLKFLIPISIFIFLWILWGIILGKPNPFLLSPINISAPSVGELDASYNIRKQLGNRFYNFIGLFVDSPHPRITGVGLGFYRFSLVGAISLSGLFFFLLSLLKYLKNNNIHFFLQYIFYSVIIPAFFIVIISQGAYSRRGLAENLFPIVYLVLLLGINYIFSLKPIIFLLGISIFCFENIRLLIDLDMKPLLPYFIESNKTQLYNCLLSSIILCYILFTALTIIYAYKKQEHKNSGNISSNALSKRRKRNRHIN